MQLRIFLLVLLFLRQRCRRRFIYHWRRCSHWWTRGTNQNRIDLCLSVSSSSSSSPLFFLHPYSTLPLLHPFLYSSFVSYVRFFRLQSWIEEWSWNKKLYFNVLKRRHRRRKKNARSNPPNRPLQLQRIHRTKHRTQFKLTTCDRFIFDNWMIRHCPSTTFLRFQQGDIFQIHIPQCHCPLERNFSASVHRSVRSRVDVLRLDWKYHRSSTRRRRLAIGIFFGFSVDPSTRVNDKCPCSLTIPWHNHSSIGDRCSIIFRSIGVKLSSKVNFFICWSIDQYWSLMVRSIWTVALDGSLSSKKYHRLSGKSYASSATFAPMVRTLDK